MILKIDNRETSRMCEVAKMFSKKHKIIIEELPIGDYIFTDGKTSVVFEYKTYNDFVKSVNEGRVFDQAIRQYNNFTYHFIVIELNSKNTKKHNLLSHEKFCDAIARLNTFTTVITSPSSKLAFKLMEKQAELCLEKHPMTNKPKEKLDNVAYNYLMLIQGIDKVKAHTICKHLQLETFDDLKNVTTKRLLKVPGIGPVMAQRIITSIKI